jgi:hypothetical protein
MTACSRSPIDGPPSPATGVRGTVVVEPSCPVQSLRSICAKRPWQGTIEATSAAGVPIGEVRTDASGAFELPLDPGAYQLTPQAVSGQGKIANVTVPSAGFATVTLYVDIGIR